MNSNESKAAKFRFELLHPKHWPIWLAFGLWRFVTIFPFPILLMMGKALGLLVHALPNRRRHIAKRNIEICFPEKTTTEQQQLLRDNFISMGIAIMETGMAWWWSKRRFAKLIKYDGLEHFDSVNPGQGIMLLGIHYTTLEIGGGAISMAAQMDGMYRAHGNPVYDFIQVRGRASKGE
ncbi:MAG TPA: lipid A biosynthesis lauroyl acyltransferase, partial [Porticoccaceae bacterium]|nr:lipid A biosynthesis lauroyl acyltransferase [Porticoccaceae bacterium]